MLEGIFFGLTKLGNDYPDRFLRFFQRDPHRFTAFHRFELRTKRHILPIASGFDNQLLAHVTVQDISAILVGLCAEINVRFGADDKEKESRHRVALQERKPRLLHRRSRKRRLLLQEGIVSDAELARTYLALLVCATPS